jgi:hypothetical protein
VIAILMNAETDETQMVRAFSAWVIAGNHTGHGVGTESSRIHGLAHTSCTTILYVEIAPGFGT